MSIDDNAEALEAVCVHELLPLFEKAYTKKVNAFARYWHDDDPEATPKGGRNYATFRDFVVNCSKHEAGRFGDGPFLRYEDMLAASKGLSASDAVRQLAPEGVAERINIRWFTLAATRFLESQRFTKKPADLTGLHVLYRPPLGLYFVEKTATKHH